MTQVLRSKLSPWMVNGKRTLCRRERKQLPSRRELEEPPRAPSLPAFHPGFQMLQPRIWGPQVPR